MPVRSPALKRSTGMAQTDSVKYGDIDGDGTVTTSDAYLAQRAFLGQVELDERQKKAADVNGDGIINATDALLIEKYFLGEIDKFPVEKEQKEPQKVRNLRSDIASLETRIANLRPFDELPSWRRKRLKKAIDLADKANILVENEDRFTEAKTKYDEALRLFKDGTPPENGGSNGNGGNGNGGNGGGTVVDGGVGGDGQIVAGIDNTALVLGAGVAATGIIALVASG